VFFFHRYQGIFPTPTSMIIVNSLCFSWAHILFANWIILFLTLFGGILFALRYHRYKSLTHIFFEHSLWGNWLFTIGYAHYFQGGSIGQYFQ
jgi:membrane protease YdiL (CAAX protease family)